MKPKIKSNDEQTVAPGPPWNKYVINYGGGVASFWTYETDAELVRRAFYRCAYHCFGIRKSVSEYIVQAAYPGVQLPLPFRGVDGTHLLTHHSDEIFFDAAFELDGDWWKLHSESGDWCSCAMRGVPELSCDVHHFYVPDHDARCDCDRRL